MAALHWGAATDAGRIRDENEDAFVAEAMVFVVADGMGGHQAGEVAAALAVSTLRDRLHDGATSTDVVIAAVVEANAAIFQTAHNNAAQRGMGTTLTAIAVMPTTDARHEQLAVVNVGDSRAYLLRQGELTRATVDHSYVQELLATGHITESEARTHPRRNIVTRALGIEPIVRVDAWVLPLVRFDRFVLCSDGLVDEVDDGEILQIITANTDPQAAADALVAAAVSNGGRDNVTVIVIDVVDGIDPVAFVAGLADTDGDDETIELSRRFADADPLPITDQVVVTAGPIKRIKRRLGRKLSASTFVAFLIGAVIITVVATLIAVAVTNSTNDAPVPSTVPATSEPATTPRTTTPRTTTPRTTTPTRTTTPRATTTTTTTPPGDGATNITR